MGNFDKERVKVGLLQTGYLVDISCGIFPLYNIEKELRGALLLSISPLGEYQNMDADSIYV